MSYALVDVKKSGSSTSLTGWSVNSGDRTIGVPANTAYGTYLVTVRCNEANANVFKNVNKMTEIDQEDIKRNQRRIKQEAKQEYKDHFDYYRNF